LGIEVEIPAKIEKEGLVAISGAVLSGVFSNVVPNENVSLESVDGNLLVKTKKSKIKLKGQPNEDFPTIPRVTGTEFEIDSKKLIDGIKSVYYSSSPSDIKPEISSVFIYTNEENLVFVSTDSFRLAEKKVKVKGLPEISGILIPFKNVSEILRVFSEYSSVVKVSFNKNQISFSSPGVYLTSRVIDGVFPDYKQIIPKSFGTEVVALKQDIVNALKISNIFSDKFNQVHLTIDPKQKLFEIQTKNSDIGENQTTVDAALTGDRMEINFNYRYLTDGFQSIDADSVTLQLNGLNKPVVIRPVSGDQTFLYLVMPMNR
jgi:DNA polymerase-3 subunit beta